MGPGVIQGDGVDYESVPKILGALKDAGRPWQEGVSKSHSTTTCEIDLVQLSSISGHGGFSKLEG